MNPVKQNLIKKCIDNDCYEWTLTGDKQVV